MCSWRLKLDATPSNLNLVGVIFNFLLLMSFQTVKINMKC